MFLNKYKNKRRLGKGAYGDVFLVQDQKGASYALKIMSVKMIESQPHLRQYLDGQIQCMKSMDSPYIIKLYEVSEDKDSIYLLLEYCDGGDLINYQAKLKDRVFTIDKATQVLSQVIIGLQNLHNEGYLHRDIKSQNVLFKNQNGKEMFKLADFGFSKKKQDIGGTILGTDQFMSPQIFSGNDQTTYGFEVDMWAFGVLFYFMLNMEFPFKLNTHWQPERKQVELKKLANNFSYKATVQTSKKQLVGNCTSDLEDLFKQMFNTNGDDRITFSEIRKHPIFAKHFPVVAEASKILYSKKFQPSKIIKKQDKKKVPQNMKSIDQQDNMTPKSTIHRPKDKVFPVQKQILERKKDQIDFLRDNAYEFIEVGDILGKHESLMLSFNLLKYYLILLKNFKLSLTSNELNKQYPGLKWNEFIKTKQFKNIQKQVEDDYISNQSRFQQIFDQCESFLKQITEINSKFKAAFYRDIQTNSFEGPFKESYRKSTIYIFGVLRQILKNKANKKGNKLNYTLSMLVISHAFNNIFSDLENLGIIFKDYLQEKKKKVQKIDYSELREWMSKSKESILNNIAKNIIKVYFTA